MKSLTDIQKKLSGDKKNEIAKILHCKSDNEKDIQQAILSAAGIHAVLKSLNAKELEIIKSVYDGGDGATLGELEKATHTTVPELEIHTTNLSQKLLLYVIKNRQLLTNKLDKIYGISEIAELINIKDTADVHERLKKIKTALETRAGDAGLLQKISDAKIVQFLRHLAASGGIVSFEEAAALITPSSFNKTMGYIVQERLASIVHTISPEFRTFIILNEKLAPSIIGEMKKHDAPSTDDIRNQYRFVLNILYTYDAISTFGLFLTKQMKFRKIDQKRITDSMIAIKEITGKNIDPEETAQLALFFLNRMKCLSMHKDVASISISSLKNDFEEPQSLLMKILHSLELTDNFNELFLPMTDIPSYRVISSILKTMTKLPEATLEHLRIITVTGLLASAPARNSLQETIDLRQSMSEQFLSALNLLCVTGIIDIVKGHVQLSEIGMEIASRTARVKTTVPVPEPRKCIYINPDFSLIIPAEEISSLSLYHIMTHTEITRDDVILNAMITRSSIVTAHKRGLPLKTFIDTLNAHSKNQIPQNMKFLLNEWSRQTLRITVTEAVLLQTSHPTFLDELAFSKKKSGLIEKLSPNYAIIDIKYLDDIVKIARKHDVVISLFENLEGE